MSNIFAVTAELKRCSIACKFNGQVFEINKDLDASTYLVKLAQDFCEEHKINLTKIDRIITASGPGSFTGIRTAQSFVKGLSLALKIPAVCASYFQVIKDMFGQEKGFVAIIKSAKNQAYFYNFSTNDFGVCPYDKLPTDIPLVGDRIEEILPKVTRGFFEIKDFRDAVNLLELTEFNSKVVPLYINAQYRHS